jgi:hypothetical protein
MNNKKEAFFKIPEYFHDYGLQCFSHIEYDILHYILRNTIGWNRYEFEVSIKKIALIKHYSEKNIIKAINKLIEKTGVFDKEVYREKGSYIKKTRYFITENSVKVLNEYVRNNIPDDYFEKIEAIKNRKNEAVERLENKKQELIEKQQTLLPVLEVATNETTENDDDKFNKNYLLGAWKEIINDYDANECREDTFKEYKELVYDGYLGFIPQETDDDTIDIRLSDLMGLTDDSKTIDFYTTLIKRKKMVGGQSNFFYNTLKINFGFKAKNIERINVIYE